MSLPSEPVAGPPTSDLQRYERTAHTAAIACVIIAPVLALLPPRKLDMYTLGLGGLTFYSGNRLYKESHGGKNLWERALAAELGAGAELPTDRAREFQQKYRARMAAEAKAKGIDDKHMSLVDKAWYGSEQPKNWKAKREKEVQEKLAEGKGYGDIIMDQIWEVWNWGKPPS